MNMSTSLIELATPLPKQVTSVEISSFVVKRALLCLTPSIAAE
jgi:hypothetical protein